MNSFNLAIVSFLGASIFPAIAGAVLTPIMGGVINTDIVSVLGLSFVFYPFSFMATLIFGVPLFLIFQHYQLVRWWSAIISGVITAILITVCLRLPSGPHASDFAVMLPIGALSGSSFWLIWKHGASA
ncbi:YdiU family protein [Pseudomonas leptonychotis]|uniref:YdiU family protein n=1 Tax=Pseudomonas leptonychotis TaxID=2448482 RepID=UPI0010A9ABF8|nr:YdiU family protein [Pseudomonas leptonychotis]